MSRTKKSRKQGSAPTAKPKLSKQELEQVEKRVRKKTGKKAGNRQQEANRPVENSSDSGAKKDPRLGSKTPIVLGKPSSNNEKPKIKNTNKETSSTNKPIAAIRFITNESDNVTKEQELAAIEQDQALQDLIEKQEEDIALTEQEVDYYNKMMERHQTLRAELGLEDDAESDEEQSSNSEDDLWDKLDNQNLSDYTQDD
ncbi:MAG: Der GTPase-activating protein YihI [Colwellia sp.]